MAATGCRAIVFAFNSILQTEGGATSFRTLMDQGAPSRDFANEIAKHCDPEMADVVRAEFDELPRSFISTWLIAWRLADEAGQPFEMVSEAPSRPLEYAKAGRVAYRLEHDDDGVRMYLSHVLGHHADWFKPAAEGASDRFEVAAAI